MKKWPMLCAGVLIALLIAVPVLAAPTTIQPRALAQIHILSPAGGEWKCGSTMPITFNVSSDKIKWVNIFIKKGENVFYSFLHTAVDNPAQTTFNWPIPKDAIAGTNYTVEIVSEDAAAIRAVSAPFTLTRATVSAVDAKTAAPKTTAKTDVDFNNIKTINVTSPGATDKWTLPSDEIVAINWDHLSFQKVTTVDVLLLKSDGSVLKPLASGVAFSAGTYAWKLSGSDVLPGEYRVKVTDTASGEVQGTSEIFALLAPSLTMLTPAAGEIWIEGTNRTFNWSYSGSSKQKVQLLDGDALIADNVSIAAGNAGPGKGRLEIKVPMIRQNYMGEYEQAKTFTLKTTGGMSVSATRSVSVATPVPIIVSPAGDQSWTWGSSHYVNWTYNGNPSDPVDVKLTMYKSPYVSETKLLGTVPAGSGSFEITQGVLYDYANQNGLNRLSFRIVLVRNDIAGVLSQYVKNESGKITVE